MSDPLADMFTRILNGQKAGKAEICLPASNIKYAVSQVLKSEGYIEDSRLVTDGNKTKLVILLKYFRCVPVISSLRRVSKPGRRIYKECKELPTVLGGMGIAIISTSKGVMTDHQARENSHGGEVICFVS